MNYELCPETDLNGVTSSALDGFALTSEHIGDYGGDPRNISISGIPQARTSPLKSWS